MRARRDTGAAAEASRSGETRTQSPRNAHREAAAALNFWQAVEYLAPQELREARTEDCVWEFDAEADERELPWNDPTKQTVLEAKLGPKVRFQVICGVVGGDDLIQAARRSLDAAAVDLSEGRRPRPVACIVLDADGRGMATGQVFVSTLPWAMGRLAQSTGKRGALEFDGFFGPDGLEEMMRRRVRDLLIERALIRAQASSGEDRASEQADDAESRAGQPDACTPLSAASRTDADEEPPSGVARKIASAHEPDANEELSPLRQLTGQDVHAVAKLVFKLCGWAPPTRQRWRVKGIRVTKHALQTQDDPLNSFYAEDLERISRAWAKADAGAGLREYLKGEDRFGRVDLEQDQAALLDGVSPARLPSGCWPSTFPLVTAQQFAVNTALRELVGGGLFSVNGPPGTGKTTLLKDLVAAIVVQRADAMLAFASPDGALTERLTIEFKYGRAYKLDSRLCGFGIVVASANNNAVENITKELPIRGAVKRDLDLDYFAVVADSVAAPKSASKREAVCWGMVAAALGNKDNRNHFAGRFWFESQKKSGRSVTSEPDPARLRTLRGVMESGEHGALAWAEAWTRYKAAKAKAQELTARCEAARDALRELDVVIAEEVGLSSELANSEAELSRLQRAADEARAHFDAAQAQHSRVLAMYAAFSSLSAAQRAIEVTRRELADAEARWPEGGQEAARATHAEAVRTLEDVKEDLQLHAQKKPGFWIELFRLESSKRWNVRDAELEQQLRSAREAVTTATAELASLDALDSRLRQLRAAMAEAESPICQLAKNAELAGVTPMDTETSLIASHLRSEDALTTQLRLQAHAAAELQRCTGRLRDLREQLQHAQARSALLKSKLDTANLTERDLRNFQPTQVDRDSMHKLSPFQSEALFDARRAVFVAALELHKSFIATAWSRLVPALRAFIDLLQGKLAPHQVPGGVMQLWDAFFLVVPVISSTFAALPRQFAGVGREALAWLLIDEAGQATPQQAVGAIWRAKRTVVVGDPLQLEPICQVPEEIMAPLLVRCAAERQWLPTAASAQTLADRANRYGTWFGNKEVSELLWVGCPLLVHRRCLDPMFTISNGIAYADKMVYGTSSDPGNCADIPSHWIHVHAGSSDGHWVDAQARKALALVHELTGGVLREDERLKVYVITPFNTVADKMKDLLYNHFGDASRGMAGTVHTFQGKEAEYVIFLLGGDPSRPGVISGFAGAKPNLVNVAVTRARRRLYVIGDLQFWTGSSDVHRIYNRMAQELEPALSKANHPRD